MSSVFGFRLLIKLNGIIFHRITCIFQRKRIITMNDTILNEFVWFPKTHGFLRENESYFF